MAFVFPSSPIVGQTFSPVGGPTYTWNGVAWTAASSGGGGSGTVNSGTAGQLAYYAATGTAVSGLTLGTGVSTALGLAANTAGGLVVPAAALAANALVIGGGSGTGPSTTTTGTGVITALGIATNGVGGIATTAAAFTAGSVVFSNGTQLQQDNANLFWDDTNNRLGLGTATPATQLYVSKNAASAISALGNSTGTVTLDMSTANNFSMTLTGNVTLANPTNLTAGQSGVIYITQDATGSRTMAFGANWDFPGATAPTLTTSANAVDVLVYSVRSTTSIAAQLLANIG